MIGVSAPDVLIGGAFVGRRTVIVDGERIAAVLDAPPPGLEQHHELASGFLTAGLIDVHVNGAFGVDFASVPPGQWAPVLRELAARGVTTVLPTFITAPLTELAAAGGRCEAADRDRPADAARVLGAHLEGPFLAPSRKGAHRAELLVDPGEADIDRLLDATPPRMVTLAPERAGATAAIERLTAHGVVVAVGHTEATALQVREAAAAGATVVTHLFNAQRPLGHREPGVPGAALSDARYHVCLIVDGIHVHPDVLKVVFAAAPERVIAVTDAIATAGLPAGTTLDFGGEPVTVDTGGVGRRADGTLAGAGITLDEGVRRVVAAGIDPATALHAATANPARAMRCTHLGELKPGAAADLVHWSHQLRAMRVWLGGRDLRVTVAADP